MDPSPPIICHPRGQGFLQAPGGEVRFQQSTFNDSNSHRSRADLLARATLLLLWWRLAVLWLEELLGLAVKVSSLTSSQDVTLVP